MSVMCWFRRPCALGREGGLLRREALFLPRTVLNVVNVRKAGSRRQGPGVGKE